jgi:hypothetical protein
MNKSAHMWNLIRRTKPKTECSDAISIGTLCDYFSDKFSAPPSNNAELDSVKRRIEDKYKKISNSESSCNDVVSISVHKIKRYIKKLNNNCSPGLDGITAEHLKQAMNTKLPLYLSHMLSLCVQFGIVPESFRHGLLIPIFKKPTLNPSEGKSYRPITVSVTFSKLLEYYILEECSNHEYSEFQFGFVSHRSTNMAIALAHDIMEYNKSKGSSVFVCSLDAEGAFDTIPFSTLFDCANALPDKCWRIMYNWYTNIYVHLKWNNKLSLPIKINRGTRQGGLTSPMIFNMFYQSLIDELNASEHGIIIDNHKYNALCYADDILLLSTTVTGLQSMINTAVAHITRKGLRFNPQKTECFISGKNPFVPDPQWHIGNTPLAVKDSIKYLGATFGNSRGLSHALSRRTNSNKAFYSLQGAGLYKNVTDPQAAMHIYQTAVMSGLLYGCNSIDISKSNKKMLEITQGKQIKTILGLNYNTHSSKLLQSLGIDPVSKTMQISSLDLLSSCINSTSATKKFYMFLYNCDKMAHSKTLVGRTKEFCDDNNINLMKYVLDSSHKRSTKLKLQRHLPAGNDGIVDSVRTLLWNYSATNCKVLNNMLKAF